MNKLIVSVCLTIYLFVSCIDVSDNFSVVLFDDAMSDIYKNRQKSWIFVGNYNINSLIEDPVVSKFVKTHKDFNFYFCDLTKSENEHINYIYQLENLPVAMLLSSEREVLYISDEPFSRRLFNKFNAFCLAYDEYRSIEFINYNFDSINDTLTKLYTDTYNAYRFYKKINMKASLESIRKSIVTEPYFYNLYLASRIYSDIGDSLSAESYKNQAVAWFESNDRPLYAYLCMDLLDKEETKVPIIEIDNKTVDFGDISANADSEYIVTYKNIGNAPLLILNATTSCSCVSVKWDKSVQPGECGEMVVKYNADNRKGPFHQTIILVTNTIQKGEKLSVIGNII